MTPVFQQVDSAVPVTQLMTEQHHSVVGAEVGAATVDGQEVGRGGMEEGSAAGRRP